MESKLRFILPRKKALNRSLSLLYKVFRLVLLVGISYYVLFPILSMIIKAITLPDDMYAESHVWVPDNPTLTNFSAVLKFFKYKEHMLITLQIALGSTALQLISCSLAGYGLARHNFKGNGFVFLLVVFTIVMPLEAIMLPMNLEYRNFDFFGIGSLIGLFTGEPLTSNLLQTQWVYYIPAACGVGLNSGLYIFIFRQFFKGLPSSLEDAARVDGCNSFQTFVRVMIPNTLPVFVTVALLSVVAYWNDTVIAGLLYNLSDRAPLMLYLRYAINYDTALAMQMNGVEYFSTYYTALLMVVAPMMIFYIVLQKFFTQCMDRSGIKG